MPLPKSVIILGAIGLALILGAIVSTIATFIVLRGQIGENWSFLNASLLVVRKRILDLEEENDYLFEEHGDINGAHVPITLARTTVDSLNQASEDVQPELCQTRPVFGSCGSKIERWFYDMEIGDCRSFPWSGCGGNENNFLTLRQCQAACRSPNNYVTKHGVPESLAPVREFGLSTDHDLTPDTQNHEIVFNKTACDLMAEAGPCPQRLPRFYHHAGYCFQFLYGGCGGNQNNFFSELECKMKCVFSRPESVGNPALRIEAEILNPTNICLLPLNEGSCGENVTRFRFNSSLNDCEPFPFGGCEGNENNFAKLSKCRKICNP
ncbi:hypothetical protein TCAL_05435 [Tigriopus californicus]|uniref:BPTI/Kunitz inhibitor domain-containing protein n=1 Tax=Tigriopus californicus TaxID=6832 RepID=A0A553NZ11_TIGCA|nr:actinia tenebrosa protease inhibitors-like [Tigriopus californicus]TRY70683.1 hypothetical protein TCAL_05435 [Tigriopus californicus]|eukprot:TCALIF_05435-PA protein Name:"Similar to mig-6 Papilin (Caenorhabditis elegans)" AED:0.10 eAED:0.10 QI:425/1/1/1/1/1/3/41/322